MSEFKRACSKTDCKKQGARFISAKEKPEGAWYCYPHGDEVMESISNIRKDK